MARPESILIDPTGQRMFVADTGNGLVRCVDQRTGEMKVLAGSLSATAAPTTVAAIATEVRLLRPAGLAFDPIEQELFLVDQERAQLLVVDLDASLAPQIRVLPFPPGEFLVRPSHVAFHRFPSGQKILLVADRAVPGAGGSQPQAVPSPSLRIIDLAAGAHARLLSHLPMRRLVDVVTRAAADGSLEVLVAADLEQLEEVNSSAYSLSSVFGFEAELYDGFDNDFVFGSPADGVDAVDQDSNSPLNIQVMKLRIPATGIAIASGSRFKGRFKADLPSLTVGDNSALAAGDLDEDGDLDLVCTGLDGSANLNLRILLRAANGQYQESGSPLVLPANAVIAGIAITDLDGDGDQDIAALNAASTTAGTSEIRTFLRNASGQYVQPNPTVPAIQFGSATLFKPTSLVAADLDGDGDQDLAACGDRVSATTGVVDQVVAIWLRGSTGAYLLQPLRTGVSSSNNRVSDLRAEDLDLDGLRDLVLVSAAGHVTVLYRNIGLPLSYQAPAFSIFHSSTTRNDFSKFSMAVADVDGDGRPDFLAANPALGIVSFLLQRFPRSFSLVSSSLPGTPFAPVSIGGGSSFKIEPADFDRDGDQDFVLTASGSNPGGPTRGILILMEQVRSGSFDMWQPFLQTSAFGSNFPESTLLVRDLDGDGLKEIVFGDEVDFQGAYRIFSCKGPTEQRILKGHRRFLIQNNSEFDPSCPGTPLINPTRLSIPPDMPDLVVDAVALDPSGNLYVSDALKGTIRKVNFDTEGKFLSSTIVAGIEESAGLPFDGDYPTATRLGRILDFTVDDLGNLYFVDTLNNRVRKAWIAPLLGN